MRLESIKIHGMGPFEDAEVKLDEINGTVIAVQGKNGEGKTILLELWPGLMYRDLPTRGSLTRVAAKRDSYVSGTIHNGQRYRITQSVDAHTQKGETLLLDADNVPLMDTTKVSEYDKWAERNLPNPNVFFTGPFAVQGRLGIIDMKPAQRKSTLLKSIGVERYESMAKQARKNAETTKGKLNTLTARIADEKKRGGDVDQAMKQLTELTIALEQAAMGVTDARLAYDRALSASEDSKRALEIKSQREQITTRLAAAKREITETERRIDNNRQLIGKGDEIRAAVARTAEIDKGLTEIRDRRKEIEKVMAVATADQKSLRKEFDELNDRGQRLQREKGEVERTLSQREAVEKAAKDLIVLREKVEDLEAEKNALEERNTEIATFLLTRKDERIDGLRSGLTAIAGDRYSILEDPIIAVNTADKTLEKDDDVAKRGEDAPIEAAKNKEHIAELAAKLEKAKRALRDAEGLASTKSFLVKAEEKHRAITTEIEQIVDKAVEITSKLDKKQEELKAAQTDLGILDDQQTPLHLEKKQLERLVGMAEKLNQAEARIDELNRAFERAKERVTAAERELEATPALDVKIIDIGKYAEAIKTAERAHAEKIEAVARAKQAVESAEQSAQRIVELTRELDAVAADLADWTRLAHDLGRDGLQAIEIDAAVPELNQVANDLLHSAFGPRFTVEIKANKTSASGKEELEGLEIRMIDTVKGRDDLIEFYSGGEKVWGAEAIALAQTYMLCRSYGIERPTIARDETAGALDQEYGDAYVRMLRRAAEMIKADKILFVSHSPTMQDGADARILIKDGSIEVM